MNIDSIRIKKLFTSRVLKWKLLIYFAIFLCLAGVTIYPDEQAYWIQLFRGHRDSWTINNFMPMCESFWTTKVPYSWRIGREFLYYINGVIERPLLFRVLGLSYFLFLIILFFSLEKKIIGHIQTNIGFFNILFFGFIPISLVYLRPEVMMLSCLLLAILIYEHSLSIEKWSNLKILIILFLYCIEVNLHGRAIFMAPIFLYIIGSIVLKNKITFVKIILFSVFIWIFIDTLSTYRVLYDCGDNKYVKEIIDSLRFNPETIKSGFKVFISELTIRHRDVYNVFKGAVFFNPHGAFPLGPKDFGALTLDLFGFVKTILLCISIFTILGLIYLATYISRMSSESKNRYYLSCCLMVFLYLDVILMKTDRFYEASIVFPIIILILIYQINIFHSLNMVWHGKISLFAKKMIFICFYIMTTIFVAYYGGELILKGGITYVSIRNHDSDLYRDAIQRAASTSDIDLKRSTLIVGDFHTIHYTAVGSFPVMANLFWWFSDKSTANYSDDYGKLKLLTDLNSSGLIMRCDSLPEKLRSEASITLINQNGLKTLENTICVISNHDLKNINYQDKLIKR